MLPIVYLDQQVKLACPNAHGVSIGRWNDKTTWRVTGPVTVAEQDAARAIFASFDPATWVSPPNPLAAALDSATTLPQLRAAIKQALGL